MTRSRPLRFLLVLGAGWATARIVFLSPGWWTAPAAATGARAVPRPAAVVPPAERRAGELRRRAAPGPTALVRGPGAPRPGRAPPAARAMPLAVAREPLDPARPIRMTAAAPTAIPPAPSAPRSRGGGRLSTYGWAFLRGGDGSGLAPGGTLGGAQAGLRTLYRLSGGSARPLALSARLSSPLRDPAGAEAALGVDWRPWRRTPLHLLAERRQRLGREGRSAFGLTLYGGVSDAPLGRLRIDAYAQAGLVGLRTRDPFADGSLRVSLALGRARFGGGAWAAAQPGAERVDVGPQASIRLPLAGRSVTLAADWRLRIAGDASPGSGPTVTLATDF